MALVFVLVPTLPPVAVGEVFGDVLVLKTDTIPEFAGRDEPVLERETVGGLV